MGMKPFHVPSTLKLIAFFFDYYYYTYICMCMHKYYEYNSLSPFLLCVYGFKANNIALDNQ